MTKKTIHHLYQLTICGMVLLTTMLSQSCSMMEEKLPECMTQVRLYLKYDYNMDRADMFHDQVGEVRIFVIDNSNNTVLKDTVVSNRDNNNAILNNKDRYFSVVFTDLPLAKEYTFMAMALNRPYDECITSQKDKFLATFPQWGDSKTKFQMHLTHAETPDILNRYKVSASENGLDILWMGHTTRVITTPENNYSNTTIEDTISMVRDTKFLNIALYNLDEDKKTEMHHKDYRIEIENDNCLLGWDNTVLPHAQLLYTPHVQWTVPRLNDTGDTLYTSANYEISYSRLMASGVDPTKAAKLHIIRNSDNEEIVTLNLPSYLAGARGYYAWNYSEQEYLDREHNYSLDFFLIGDTWKYMNVRINVTPWVIRRDNIYL